MYGGPGGHASFIPVAISIILVATSVSPVTTSVIDILALSFYSSSVIPVADIPPSSVIPVATHD